MLIQKRACLIIEYKPELLKISSFLLHVYVFIFLLLQIYCKVTPNFSYLNYQIMKKWIKKRYDAVYSFQ